MSLKNAMCFHSLQGTLDSTQHPGRPHAAKTNALCDTCLFASNGALGLSGPRSVAVESISFIVTFILTNLELSSKPLP